MASANTITVEPRSTSGKGPARRTRVAGRVPGVIYGGGGTALSVSAGLRDVERIANYGRLIDLNVSGESAARKVLLKEVQRNFLGTKIMHVDFHEVDEQQIVYQEVPIRITGDAKGVSTGGLLVQQVFSILVECTVASIPEYLYVDVSDLGVEESITVGSMAFPEGVKAHDTDPNVLVVMVAKQRVKN
jgi:large subunit ribosomal protein L25